LENGFKVIFAQAFTEFQSAHIARSAVSAAQVQRSTVYSKLFDTVYSKLLAV
jgi:hypothetical protein